MTSESGSDGLRKRGGPITTKLGLAIAGPTLDDVRSLDRELAREGFDIVDRPVEARNRWMTRSQPGGTQFLDDMRAIDTGFEALYPHVDFRGEGFIKLAVSALGASYPCTAPMLFGRPHVSPLDFISMDVERSNEIWTADPAAWWEMVYQAADVFDLQTAYFNSKLGGQKFDIGVAQLQAAAAALVRGHPDASLAQSCSLVAEMMLKGALEQAGLNEQALRKCGHDLHQLVKRLGSLRCATQGDELARVVSGIPAYVDARYKPIRRSAPELQGIFRRSLFVAAEITREPGQDSALRSLLEQGPPRQWG